MDTRRHEAVAQRNILIRGQHAGVAKAAVLAVAHGRTRTGLGCHKRSACRASVSQERKARPAKLCPRLAAVDVRKRR
jgi:hypothetical protein